MRMNFALSSGKLILMEEAVEQMLGYRQLDLKDKEAGGLLIGRFPLQGNHRVVESVTVPYFMDRRRRSFFFRSCFHNLKLHRAWKISSSTLTLLGAWHTHPEPVPTPSSTDLKDWNSLLRKGKYEGSSLVFLIVGTERTNAWIGFKNGVCKQLTEL